MRILVLPEQFCICRLEIQDDIPVWAKKSKLFSITKTIDELSIVCEQNDVPAQIKSERDFRALKVLGPLDFSLTGILSSIAGPLAEVKVSIFAISTYDTDYILVREQDLDKAIVTLKSKGIDILQYE